MHFLQMSCKIIFIIIVWLQKISIPPLPHGRLFYMHSPPPPPGFSFPGGSLMTTLSPEISRIFQMGTSYHPRTDLPTSERQKSCDSEPEAGKSSQNWGKATRFLNYRVTWRNLQQGLWVNKVAFHVKLQQWTSSLLLICTHLLVATLK